MSNNTLSYIIQYTASGNIYNIIERVGKRGTRRSYGLPTYYNTST